MQMSLTHVITNEGVKLSDDDAVHRLPGQPDGSPFFNQYGGYVTVEATNGRSLYYYFVEAPKDPDSKPLFLWLNGGPGCSSMVGAMVDEIGPFGVSPDRKTLYKRNFSWNEVVNVLFLESPVGVGFSYSNTSSDYEQSGDVRTAQDSYAFLINWFERFPQYKTRDFYISGESYADVILKANTKLDLEHRIQLKGIMVGNGLINMETDMRGSIDFRWSHALISDEAYQYLIGNCSSNACAYPSDDYGIIDPCNIYGPVCGVPSDEVVMSHNRLSRKSFNRRRALRGCVCGTRCPAPRTIANVNPSYTIRYPATCIYI